MCCGCGCVAVVRREEGLRLRYADVQTECAMRSLRGVRLGDGDTTRLRLPQVPASPGTVMMMMMMMMMMMTQLGCAYHKCQPLKVP